MSPKRRVGGIVKSLNTGSVNLISNSLTTVQRIRPFPTWEMFQLVLLLPNTTSILHAMDEDVIRSLKAHYRGRFVHFLCRALEKNEPYPKILILQAMKIIADC